MAYLWRLGDFISGEITRSEPLPVTRGASEVDLDIHSEDSTKLVIPLASLSPEERNDWHNTFHELRAFCVLENNSVAWDAPGAILFAGFVNKITPKLSPQTIELQLTGMEEYTKARIIGETFNTKITDPTKAVDFEAENWQGVMNAMIKRMFDNALIPAGLPRNPAVLGSVGSSTGTGKKKTVLITDAVSYGSALKEVSEKDSGLGLEYRFVPRWASSAKNKVVWDFITGTEQYPHINEVNTVSITLAENSEKISSWDTTIDSNDLYSSLYLQSKGGNDETKDGADFVGKALTAQRFPILVERFFNPGVELTDGQIEEQLNARIEFAGRSKYTAGFTVEEKGNPSEWIQRIGATLNISGLPDTISAGHTANLRCVGISFTPGKGTISVEVMQKQPVYPRLPKKNLSGLITGGSGNNDSGRVPSGGSGGSGGGGTTPPIPSVPEVPDNGWANEGVLNPEDLWGSEGRDPWDTFPTTLNDPLFGNYKEAEQTYDNWDGESPVHPMTIFQTEGNRVYGMDESTVGWASKYTDGAETFEIRGGINRDTGMPVNPNALKPIYIKKSFMDSNGGMGKWETVSEIPVSKLMEAFPAWQKNPAYYETGQYRSQIWRTAWYAKSRIYVGILWHHLTGSAGITGSATAGQWFSNTKVTFFSSAVNMKTGEVSNEWKTENLKFPNRVFPMTQNISRFGDVVVFGAGILYHETSFMNLSFGQLKTAIDPDPIFGDKKRHVTEDGWVIPGIPGFPIYSGDDNKQTRPNYDYEATIGMYGTTYSTPFGDDHDTSMQLSNWGFNTQANGGGNVSKDFSDSNSKFKEIRSWGNFTPLEERNDKIGYFFLSPATGSGMMLGMARAGGASGSDVLQAVPYRNTEVANKIDLIGVGFSNSSVGGGGTNTTCKGWFIIGDSNPGSSGTGLYAKKINDDFTLGASKSNEQLVEGPGQDLTKNFSPHNYLPSTMIWAVDFTGGWGVTGGGSRLLSYGGQIFTVNMTAQNRYIIKSLKIKEG